MLPRHTLETNGHTDAVDPNGTESAELTVMLASVLVLATMGASADTASVTTVNLVGQRADYAYDDMAAKVVRLQHHLGSGPGLTAVNAAALIRVADLAAETRWPEWSSAARGLGVGGVLSVPFTESGVSKSETITGSLDLYWFGPRAFSARDMNAARLVVQHVAKLLDAHNLLDQLGRAVELAQ